MFTIPAYQNRAFIAGRQLFNVGQGGPQSHMGILAAQPRAYPTTYRVGTYGLGAMPRQVIGPTLAVAVNQYSDPLVFNNLEIPGIFKSPIPARA